MRKKLTIVLSVAIALMALSSSRVKGAQILVVDADGSAYYADYADVRPFFTDALGTCGYSYDIWEKMTAGEDGPDQTVMQDYDAVVWFTGECWTNAQTLTADDEAELALYLDGGGNLFLSAQDYFYDRYPLAGSFSPGQFPFDYLGVTSVTQDACIVLNPETGHADGYAGSVAQGYSYDLWDPYTVTKVERHGGHRGTDDGLFIDELVIAGDAVFDADSMGVHRVDIGACQYQGAKGFKTVFTTISFASLTDGNQTRAELMCAIMSWFDVAVPVELTSFTATAGDHMVRLNWETRSELNNLGFQIHRCLEGGEFVRIDDQMIPGAGTSEETHAYTYVDRGLPNGTTYYYKIGAVDFGGNLRMHDMVVSATPTAVLPKSFALSQNYPNPFNPNTEIKYQIPKGSRVVIEIYNEMGQEVVTLVDADLETGYYTAIWNARDSRGSEVSPGIYFCRMKAGEFSQTRKMVLIK